ncbi:hypothetical protein EPUS_03835 [Endocarpon pusillum Z07020]|uniref:Uncharacterized protein n=1 Tax=Endocarpon pusillum (strain Z07020 / HMAS-L-300199) TaxID=1263415 RepID=U1HTS5_ENDPU|nr:uncharacterized protein EPUS_03835 [Endocarpon pusillum Z07020]ERF74020.1 hypothetical protein EPUS_03835 [Endocarpon pusillum Z07020]
MVFAMRLMESFSQPERFIWHDGVFTVIIPNGTRTAYHPRASVSYLKTLLIPQLRLTRAGNISSHQPPPPPPHPYDFYLAQLIHYGLDFHFETESAQRALEIEIRLGRLHVPQGLVRLEKELRKVHERKQERDRQHTVRLATQQQLGSTADTAITVDTSEDAPGDKPILRTTHGRSVKRKKAQQDVILTSDESEARSSTEQSSNGVAEDSGNESDTIAVAPDRHRGTSSGSSNSFSPEDVAAVKRSDSICSGRQSISDESSEDADGEDTSSGDDPFLEKQDYKRIKIEKADEKDDAILRSTREPGPFVVRRQLPPTQVKIRRIASQPHLNAQPFHSALKDTVGSQSTNKTIFASVSKMPPRKPFVSPDKRPSWTIPVRSPSSSQHNTPKSVTFSQFQRETPTKVSEVEKDTLSSAMKTPQRTSHRRTPSPSSDYSHTTPLRSILKKSVAHSSELLIEDGGNTEIAVQIPRNGKASPSRPRKRKRRSEANRGFHLELDGAEDPPDIPDDSYTEKPYITSDLVGGKPISSFRNGTMTQALQASSQHNASTVKSTGGWLEAKSKSYLQEQTEKGTKRDGIAKSAPVTDMCRDRKLDKPTPGNSKVKLKVTGGAENPRKGRDTFARGNENGYRDGKQLGLMGRSGSRGGLVRAGGVC